MKKKEIITNIGTINLNDVQFSENYLDVYIGIESVSEDIQKKIAGAVEIAKAEQIAFMRDYIHKDASWSDSGINTDLSLHIIVDNKKFSYLIEVDITDKENKMLWTDASVEVDLSEYQNELQKVIIKAMIDNFF